MSAADTAAARYARPSWVTIVALLCAAVVAAHDRHDESDAVAP